MTISGVYIAKNEEKNLRRSIESIRAMCDEIIVVDTGSEDGTVALAEELGAQVYHFKWRSDFAAARNFAISHAKGELILFLDADEWFAKPLDAEGAAYMSARLDEGVEVFFFPHWEYIDGNPVEMKYVVRAFKNFAGLRYEGAIHERLIRTGGSHNLPQDVFSLYHSGYAKDVRASKVARNIEGLERVIKSENNPIKRAVNLFYLAREYSSTGNAELAADYLNRFFRLYDRMPEIKKAAKIFSIAAHTLRNDMAAALYPRMFSLEDWKRVADSFVADFPTHPVSRYCAAKYEWQGSGNILKAYEWLAEAETLAARYNPDEFVGDITTYSRFSVSHYKIKGQIELLTGQRSAALDSLTQALRLGGLGRWWQLLGIIKDQAPADVAAYIEAVAPDMDAGALESLLGDLLFFPALRTVYQYFAVRHIKMTHSHCDMTAIPSLFGPDYDLEHVVQVARHMLEEDAQSANVLMCLAMMYAPDDSLYRQHAHLFNLDTILSAYYAGTHMGQYTAYESNLLHRVSRFVFFLDDSAVVDRLLGLIRWTPSVRFHLVGDYYSRAGQWDKILEQYDFSVESDIVTEAERRICYARLIEAYVGARQYERAVEICRDILSHTPTHTGARNCLNQIRCLAPALIPSIDLVVAAANAPRGVLH